MKSWIPLRSCTVSVMSWNFRGPPIFRDIAPHATPYTPLRRSSLDGYVQLLGPLFGTRNLCRRGDLVTVNFQSKPPICLSWRPPHLTPRGRGAPRRTGQPTLAKCACSAPSPSRSSGASTTVACAGSSFATAAARTGRRFQRWATRGLCVSATAARTSMPPVAPPRAPERTRARVLHGLRCGLRRGRPTTRRPAASRPSRRRPAS